MDGVGGGPVSAGSIASQAGKKMGSPDAPYTGVPGYSDTVFNPFEVAPSPPQDLNVGGDQQDDYYRAGKRYPYGEGPDFIDQGY